MYSQRYAGQLNFATDAWTAPNHRTFIALVVYFKYKGAVKILLLDLCELPISHSGANLARCLGDVLTEFRIQEKVRQNIYGVLVRDTYLGS